MRYVSSIAVKVQTGFFRNGHPCITILMYGVKHAPPGIEFTVLIDTGFSGFLLTPMEVALKLGLPLSTTTKITLADGSEPECYVANGAVTFGGTTLAGTVMLVQRKTDCLAGMDFLRLFGFTLEVNDSYVRLRPRVGQRVRRASRVEVAGAVSIVVQG